MLFINIDSDLLLGLLAGLPTCCLCRTPATRRAILEFPESKFCLKQTCSWLICENRNHESGLAGDAPSKIEALPVNVFIQKSIAVLGIDELRIFLVKQEIKRLGIEAFIGKAGPDRIHIRYGGSEWSFSNIPNILDILQKIHSDEQAFYTFYDKLRSLE